MVEQVSALKRLTWIINVVFHQIVAVLTVYVLTEIISRSSTSLSSLHTWHVILTVFGFLFLAVEGLLLFSENNICTMYLPRKQKQTIHACIYSLSVIAITAGIALQISNIGNNNGEHFSSAHSIIGLIAWIFMLCSSVLGSLSLHPEIFRNAIRAVVLKLIHEIVAICAIILGITALGFGMYKYLHVASHTTRDVAVIVMALTVAWGLIGPCRSVYNNIKNLK